MASVIGLKVGILVSASFDWIRPKLFLGELMKAIDSPAALTRAILALQAVRWAKAFVPLIRKQSDSEARAALWGALCVYYARPFTNCYGLGKFCREDVPEKYRDTHDNLLEHRHKSAAHSDSDLRLDGEVHVNNVYFRSDGNHIFIENPHLSPKTALLDNAESLLKAVESELSAKITMCLNSEPLSKCSYSEGSYRLELKQGSDDRNWHFLPVQDDGLGE